MATARFSAFATQMKAAGLAPAVIETFRHHFENLAAGEKGILSETDISPLSPGSLPRSADGSPEDRAAGEAALPHCAVIKLNGGLGTTMGLSGPKSAIPVKNGDSFLDIAIRQIISLNRREGCRVPFITMDSFSTAEATAEIRARHGELPTAVPGSFLQNRYPKVLAASLEPALWPDSPELAWNPPGHGDLYAALAASGLLAELRRAGIRYAFISNIDNLGATLEPGILGHLARSKAPFIMEVAVRTDMDRKGGHLAQSRKNGRLVLRERAQTAENDLNSFEDIQRHGYFNTNSIWLNLDALQSALDAHEGILPLPLIVNKKRLIPRDDSTPEVFQLETAVGAAIALFDGAVAMEVPRERFAPVKNCDDLLLVMSDRSILNSNEELVNAPDISPSCSVRLDEKFYGSYAGMISRFPKGVPSLKNCLSLELSGDVVFGKNISIIGAVRLAAAEGTQMRIADGEILRGEPLL